MLSLSGQRGFRTVKNRFGITVGLCVCWDIAFPEAFRHMALEHGAQLVIAPGRFCNEAFPLLNFSNNLLVSSLLDIGGCGTDWNEI